MLPPSEPSWLKYLLKATRSFNYGRDPELQPWGVGIERLTDRRYEWRFGGFAHELYDLRKPTGGIDVGVAEPFGIVEAVLLVEGVATAKPR